MVRQQEPAGRGTVARRWAWLAAPVLCIAIITVAVAGADEPEPTRSSTTVAGPDGATVIEVVGPERDGDEIGALQTVLGTWGTERGIAVEYVADADWEANILRRVERGDPPDISFFADLDVFADLARDGAIVALGGEAVDAVDNWSAAWTALGNVDGTQYGVPVEADLNSLVWYQPQAFIDAGYEVPATFDEFTTLVDTIAAANGPKALCVGIQSGQSTGWVFADWVANMVLRQHGPDLYDRWIAHGIPFNDDRIVDSMQTVLGLWSDDNVFASGGTIESTPFQDSGQSLVDGDCFMHRQASFFSIFLPEGTPLADSSPTAVDVFGFPSNDDVPSVLGSATFAAGFDEDPSVQALLAFMATPEYAAARQTAQREQGVRRDASSGFLSAAIGQDMSVYNTLEQRLVGILENAVTVRREANHTLPAEVAQTFWTEGAAAVDGSKTAAEAADAIEASWSP